MASLVFERLAEVRSLSDLCERVYVNPEDGRAMGAGYNYSSACIFTIPEELLFKKIHFSISNIACIATGHDAQPVHAEISVIDNTPANIATENETFNPNDLIDGTKSNHSNKIYVEMGTAPTGLQPTYFSISKDIIIGSGKVLLLQLFCDGNSDGVLFSSAITFKSNIYIDKGSYDNLEPLFPVNVNIKASSNNIFTWANNANVTAEELGETIYNLVVLSHSIEYRKKGSQESQTLSETNSNYYQTIEANTFDIDPYEYRVTINSYENHSLVSNWVEFNAIGANDAPTISSVTNDSIPLISWTDVNQEAYEVRIKDADQKVIYYSGVLAGTAQSYRLRKMLADGTYIVEVREINTFGYYSEWGSLEFTINPTAVNAPTNIFATTNNKYGVEISGTPDENAQKTYVVRRKVGSDDVEILGEYTGGIFTDYTAEGNTFYEYTLRNYNYAYNDGFWVPIQVKVKQVVIRDGRNPENFIPLDKSERENFGPQWTEDADRVLFNCLGRRYPVKEVGEWVNSLRTFSAYVHNRDLKRLLDMCLNAAKIYYMADGEYFACDMAIEDQGTYNQNGRIIDFTMTRIADDESVSII